MSLDRLLRGHLASSRRPAPTPGVSVIRGRDGGSVYRLDTPAAKAEADPTAGLKAALAAQQAARNNR